jgi:DNA-directed RNA polymerase subunit RPC12/RpoP
MEMNRIGLFYNCGRCQELIDNSYDLGFIPRRGGSTLRFDVICPDCGHKYQVSLQIEATDHEDA